MKMVFRNSLCFDPRQVAVINIADAPEHLEGVVELTIMLYNTATPITIYMPPTEAFEFANNIIAGEGAGGKVRFEQAAD